MLGRSRTCLCSRSFPPAAPSALECRNVFPVLPTWLWTTSLQALSTKKDGFMTYPLLPCAPTTAAPGDEVMIGAPDALFRRLLLSCPSIFAYSPVNMRLENADGSCTRE